MVILAANLGIKMAFLQELAAGQDHFLDRKVFFRT